MIGKRIGYGREAIRPHNLTLTMIGASILWFGWFGFNAGSALEAGGVAAIAFVNTFLATAAAVLAWTLVEWITQGQAVAARRGVGCGGRSGRDHAGRGLRRPQRRTGHRRDRRRALPVGRDRTEAPAAARTTALDVFGVHGVGGITGALLTGVFAAPSLGGSGIWDYVTETALPDYDIASQVWIQAQGVLVTVALSGMVALVAFLIVKYTVGLRVTEEAEREGLDISSHGEAAYES